MAANMMTESTPFLQGFRSLPTELKLLILRYTVYTTTAITYCTWLEHCDIHMICQPRSEPGPDLFDYRPCETRQLLKETVIPLLSVPEIKGLVQEAFYGVNRVVVLHCYSCLSERGVLHCPPPSVAPLIRHLEINLSCDDVCFVNFLRRLTDGTEGFNLHSVTVSIDRVIGSWRSGDEHSHSDKCSEQLGRIEFPTRHLAIESLVYGEGSKDADSAELLDCDLLDLKADGSREEKWQRYYVFFGADGPEARSEYITEKPRLVPGMSYDERIIYKYVRMTIKTVSTRFKESPYRGHRWANLPVQKQSSKS